MMFPCAERRRRAAVMIGTRLSVFTSATALAAWIGMPCTNLTRK